MRYLLLSFFLLSLFACASPRYVYENNAGSCRLELYGDSTYALKYPTFFRKEKEKGTYRIANDTVFLRSSSRTRTFLYGTDTITAKGIDPKVMTDRKLIRKK